MALTAVIALPTIANAAGDDEAGSAVTRTDSLVLFSQGPMLAVWVGAGALVLSVAFVAVMISVRRSRAAV
ncbi:hypothetical protein [Agromyces albus]|uniref:hypothetical protein n=1 Tax=Agromyces albus TaxID=205332 RepID=UPI0027D7D057|nr:hypothetical protein [Agromyces albus]